MMQPSKSLCSSLAKGRLISKCIFGVFNSILLRFSDLKAPWGALCYLLFDLKISYVHFLLYFSSILKCVLLTLEKTSKLLQSIFLQYGKTIYFHMHLQLNVAIFFYLTVNAINTKRHGSFILRYFIIYLLSHILDLKQ